MTIERVAARNVEEFFIVAGVPTSINVKICFQFLLALIYISRVQRMWFPFFSFFPISKLSIRKKKKTNHK